MNKQNATDLIKESQKYIGGIMPIHITTQEDEFLRTVNCRFSQTGAVIVGIIEESQNYSPYAKMVEVGSESMYHVVPLKTIVDEFKRVELVNDLIQRLEFHLSNIGDKGNAFEILELEINNLPNIEDAVKTLVDNGAVVVSEKDVRNKILVIESTEKGREFFGKSKTNFHQ